MSTRKGRGRLALFIAAGGLLAGLVTPAAALADGHESQPKPCLMPDTPGGDWLSYGHDPANTRTQESEQTIAPTAAATLSPAWVFSTASQGDTGSLDSTPVEAGGCVYTATTSARVFALNAADGKPVWSTTLPVAAAGLGGAIVGSPAIEGRNLYVLVNQNGDGVHGPYVADLDRATGQVIWESAPIATQVGYYTNASPEVYNGLVFVGFSPPEGEPGGQGGFALVDAGTGGVVMVTTTVSPADQRQGYAGGGIWSTPAYDPRTEYAYVGAGNPYSKTVEDPHTNAILKIDLDRERSTFGQIVGYYKGNVDQYAQALQALSQTPACAETAGQNVGVDNPVCGQLDLDFGAAPNLFASGNGRLLVGDLQKSGVYHVAYADDMSPDWSTIIGASCQLCNAASPATAGGSVYAVGTPGGVLSALGQRAGQLEWASPVLDGVHYQSISTADGVVYTTDGDGFLDAFSAATGAALLRRPMAADTGSSMVNFTSAGVAVADHTVFVAGSGGGGAIVGGFVSSSTTDTGSSGYLIAYRPTSSPVP